MTSAARVAVVIPARFASTRFPGKLLAAETGRPLIQHVYERATRAARAMTVLVATDDERIRAAVEGFGGIARMTAPDHPNGTSRIAEAARDLEADVIVNVQGDEPEIDPGLIDLVADTLVADPGAPVSTAAAPITDAREHADPNVVKVVRDQAGRALFFSRAPIPQNRDGVDDPPAAPLRHVGIYGYRRAFLETYAALAPTPLERTEHLEQLRILEHGHAIAVAVTRDPGPPGIDTPEQYAAFVERMKG